MMFLLINRFGVSQMLLRFGYNTQEYHIPLQHTRALAGLTLDQAVSTVSGRQGNTLTIIYGNRPLFTPLAAHKPLQQLVGKEPTATVHVGNVTVPTASSKAMPISIFPPQLTTISKLERAVCRDHFAFITYFLIYTSTCTHFLYIHTLTQFKRQGLAFLNTACALTQGDHRAKRQLQVPLHTWTAKKNLQPIFYFL